MRDALVSRPSRGDRRSRRIVVAGLAGLAIGVASIAGARAIAQPAAPFASAAESPHWFQITTAPTFALYVCPRPRESPPGCSAYQP